MRFFNTAGPVDCERHYCLPPLERINLPQVLHLIEQQQYFVLHAPRQTGKTSALLALMKHLNITAGLEQTWEYIDRYGAAQGHLVIFDRTPDKPWEEKLFQRQETVRGGIIKIWGM